MKLDVDRAWLSGVRRCESPNFDARPGDCEVDLVVVHGISLPPGRYGGGHVHRLFTNTLDPTEHPYFESISSLRVSAHALIERDATTTQFVAFTERAWHAGESSHCGRPACNDFSVGIELEGVDDEPYEQGQYTQLIEIVALLAIAWPNLERASVVGHQDIAPRRKTDPGEVFDWHRLHAGIAQELSGVRQWE